MSVVIRGLVVTLLCSQTSAVAVRLRATSQATSAPPTCDLTRLAARPIEGVTVQDALPIGAGGFVPRGSSTALQAPAFCRVQATATPTPLSSITFEVWVPQN